MSSSVGSNRLARSVRKGATSEGDSVSGLRDEDVDVERGGPERADKERSGVMSSGGPSGRLQGESK